MEQAVIIEEMKENLQCIQYMGELQRIGIFGQTLVANWLINTPMPESDKRIEDIKDNMFKLLDYNKDWIVSYSGNVKRLIGQVKDGPDVMNNLIENLDKSLMTMYVGILVTETSTEKDVLNYAKTLTTVVANCRVLYEKSPKS